jgi:hypothetical protein
VPVEKVTLGLSDRDVAAIARAIGRMDKAASNDLRQLSRSLAADYVVELKNAARGTRWYRDQAVRVAESIRVASDRVPSVLVGGARRFTTSEGDRTAYGTLVFGSEFGSVVQYQRDRFRNQEQRRRNKQGGLQFPPRSPKQGRGNRGWWLFPRLKRLQPDILRAWLEGARKVADEWGKQ